MSNMESADELRKRLTPAFLSLVLTSASLHPRSEPRPEDLLSRALVQMPDLLNEPELRELVGDKGLLNKEHFARHVVLKGLLEYTIKCPAGMKLSMFPLVESRLWLATHDVNEACRADAKLLWQYLTELSAVRASLAYSESITELFSHETVCVRESASHALASCLAVNPDGACKALESVKGLLLTAQPPPPPQAAPQREILRSEFPEKKSAPINASKVSSLMMIGNATKPVVKTKPIETSKVFSAPQVFQPVKVSPQVTAQNLKKENIRHTIALFFSKVGSEKVLKSLNDAKLVCTLVEFILTNGATDQSEVVRDAMLVAGRALIDGYCDSSEYCSTVLATIRSILALKLPPKSSDFEVQAFDKRRGAGVVLLGAAGKHLQKDDPAVIEITDSLVEALKTPSESVQRTVADCLAPLIQVNNF